MVHVLVVGTMISILSLHQGAGQWHQHVYIHPEKLARTWVGAAVHTNIYTWIYSFCTYVDKQSS
jgi:hypothetical protein